MSTSSQEREKDIQSNIEYVCARILRAMTNARQFSLILINAEPKSNTQRTTYFHMNEKHYCAWLPLRNNEVLVEITEHFFIAMQFKIVWTTRTHYILLYESTTYLFYCFSDFFFSFLFFRLSVLSLVLHELFFCKILHFPEKKMIF